ncbi:MAG: P-loop NTPase [Pirellulaceae bacterium]|jgi:Mrp family chromosome partitioning ATPase|nr:P-loop NTPase [Pirellulaceae bacterium]
MNALDRAFIKAFAKDRPTASSVRAEAATTARQQPPAAGVQSQMLSTGNLPGRPRQLRVDRPVAAEPVFLVPHLVMPLVQHRESYDVASIGTTSVEPVWVEDRLIDMDRAAPAAPAPACGVQREATVRPADRRAPRTDRRDQPADAVAALERWFLWVVPAGDSSAGRTCLCACLDPSTARAAVAGRCTTVVEAGHLNVDPRACTLPDSPAIEPPSVRSEHALPAAGRERLQAAAETPAMSVTPRGEAQDNAPFRPVWEVDGFGWPEAVLRLDEISHEQLSQTGEALATAVQDGLRVVAVTSAARQEGRTTVALALARAAALAGSRVALVDMDSQHPDLARQLGIDAPCDWPEILAAGQPLCEAAVASAADRVTLLPRVAPSQQLGGPPEASLVTNLLRDLQRCFDLVIVDAPEVACLTAAHGVERDAGAVDMAVLVRDAQRTAREECLAAAARLRQLGVRAVGIVENFATWDATDV